MKKFLLSAACLLGMAISASAADLAARPYTKAPVMVADVYNWTGFYIGGNVGYSWGRSEDTSTLANGAGTVLFTSFDSTNLDGIVGGGQIGYNWQSQSLVWGLEADIQGTDEKGSRAFTCPTGICTPFVPIVFNGIGVPVARIRIGTPGPAVPVSLNQSLDWFGTARGRIGFLVSPRILFYGTGGLAYGEVKSSGTVVQSVLVSKASSAGIGRPSSNICTSISAECLGASPRRLAHSAAARLSVPTVRGLQTIFFAWG